MSFICKSAILGGTFDHFHLGHKMFISAAVKKTKKLTIGIVSDPSSKAHSETIEEYSVRKNHLLLFLSKLNKISQIEVIPIHDIYGTSLTDHTLEAIFVTEATKPNAEKINVERTKLKLLPLAIEVIPFALGDDNQVISSARIRGGEIDRNGNSYLKFFTEKPSYHLPESLRDQLQQPIGTVTPQFAALPYSTPVIAVGDIVSLKLKQTGVNVAISIIDYRTRRHELDKAEVMRYFPAISHTLSNPAGTINKEIAPILLSSLSRHQQTHETQVISVDGEEDLLALPVILFAPLDARVIYGLHNVGMIVVTVTEEAKDLVMHYLKQF